MSILNQYVTIITMKIYFYLMGEENVTRDYGKSIELKTVINDVAYHCVCQELIFRATARRWLSSYRINKTYQVTMYELDGDCQPTHGTYPTMCPNTFTYTTYPHMLAIRCHYNLHYS